MKNILILVLLNIFCLNLIGQTNYKKRADDYFKYYNYQRALKDYLRLYRKDKDNPELLNNIIECILNDNTQREEAIPYIESLLKVKPNEPRLHYYHALANFHAHNFDLVEDILLTNVAMLSSDAEIQALSTRLSINTKNARALVLKPLDVSFINLGEQINSSRNEINPYVSVDEKVLFFSSDQKYNSYAGIYYFNVYVAELVDHYFEKARVIGSKVNSIYDEMVAGIDPAGSILMIYHNRDKKETMAYAQYNGNYNFDVMANFGSPLDGKGSEFGVWFSNQKDTVIFSGDSGNGDTDLYYAIKLPDGSWGNARELPGEVNTGFNENFPVLSQDGLKLYFSSDNNLSMGGYDIFVSEYDAKQRQWGEPINLGYPVNDTYDNYNISWVHGKRHAYVSAIRPEGLGARDIYKVVFNDEEPYNYIIKCDLRIQNERMIELPNYAPSVTVRDTMNYIVGIYKSSVDSAQIVMALTPGIYDVIVEEGEYPEFKKRIVVPDMYYNSVADRITLIINPTDD